MKERRTAMLHSIPLTIGLTLTINLASAQQIRLAEVDRQTALMHLRAGQEALAVEHFDEAEREFREAIRLNPRLELAHYGLGQVFMVTKRYQQAVDAFVSCRNLFQANVVEDQDQRAMYERRLDDQIESKRDELRALQSGRIRTSSPGGIDRVRNELSQLERLRGRSREPVGALPPFILTALGSAHFRTGAFADAEREWRQAVAVDPNIGEIHNNLAVVCMITGRYDEAEREIQLAEKAGFRVSEGLKNDVKTKKAGKS
jgi:tetratricopeptide (TPR) repeat protein